MPKRKLKQIVKNFRNKKIAIIGDLVADIYITGVSDRVSREAPVLIVKKRSQRIVPGGAANVAMNIIALGASIELIGVIGKDDYGDELKKNLKHAGVVVDGVVSDPSVETISKTRILAGAKHTLPQQVLRLDSDQMPMLNNEISDKILKSIKKIDKKVDGWIISDYGYNLINDAIITEMQKIAKNKPVLADSRFDIRRYNNLTIIKPNESEALQAAGIDNNNRLSILEAANILKDKLSPDVVIVTLGNQGMLVYHSEEEYRFISAVGTDKIVDLTGAGDTSAASILLSRVSGADYYESAYIANCAASVVVMKHGSATCSQKELLRVIDDSSKRGQDNSGS